VLITGCSAGGIGAALAQQFHSQGHLVFATSRTLQSMEHLQALGMKTMVLDVTDRDAIRNVKAHIADETGGKLDILINNAGQAYTVAATDFDMSEVRAHFEVNLFAAMTMVQEFVPLLIASGDGRILQIGSISGIMPVPFGGAYNASKAALQAYGNTLRVELAPFKIKVTTIVSGSVKSNIVKPRSLPENSLYRPMEDIYQAQRLSTSQHNAMDTMEYAKQVVAVALAKSPGALVWRGTKIWPCWLIDTFLPKTGFDALLSKMFGLDQLAARLKQSKNKDV